MKELVAIWAYSSCQLLALFTLAANHQRCEPGSDCYGCLVSKVPTARRWLTSETIWGNHSLQPQLVMRSPYFCRTPTPTSERHVWHDEWRKLILLIRCTTDGAASIAWDLNDIHMSRYISSMYNQGVGLYPESESPSKRRLRLHTPGHSTHVI